jgi:DAACS family dicarboxylate/amino acid:cation (Na+ or H+) symporter
VPANVAFQVDWVKFLLDLIPSNVIAAMAGQKVLPTLVFATLFGLALGAIGERARPITAVLEAILGAPFRLTDWVIKVSPIAVFAIAAWLLATQGITTILALGKLAGTIYLGYGSLALVTMVAIRLAGQRPIAVARAVSEPVLLAFVTRSSEVALPSHIEKLEQLGVPERIVSVVLPLGTASI